MSDGQTRDELVEQHVNEGNLTSQKKQIFLPSLHRHVAYKVVKFSASSRDRKVLAGGALG